MVKYSSVQIICCCLCVAQGQKDPLKLNRDSFWIPCAHFMAVCLVSARVQGMMLDQDHCLIGAISLHFLPKVNKVKQGCTFC